MDNIKNKNENLQDDLYGICPFATTQKILAGKWTILILQHLSERTMRFNELQRALPHLTQATLTKQLRMMEEKGLVRRKVYNQIPPKVEYSLTELGIEFAPVLDALEVWGQKFISYLKTQDLSDSKYMVKKEES